MADVVRALRAAGTTDAGAGSVYNIGGGSRVSLNDVLEVLAEIVGAPLDVRRSGRESGDVMHTGADISRARQDLGYEPATGVAEGLRAEVDWTAEQHDTRPGLAAAG